jgi:hypothetical protein
VPLKPLTALFFLLALLAAGCSDDGDKFSDVVEIGDGGVTPVSGNSEYVVGPNRFSVGLLAPDGRPIVDAKVHLAFYELNEGSQVKRFEMDAVSRVPARDAGLTEQITHTHVDGSRHVHLNVNEAVGIYTANVTFDKPGQWGVEIAMDASNPSLKATLRPTFFVLAESETPAIGSVAPRSRNLTVADVSDISQIDSSANPSPEMHTTTIADAIAAGKPSLVLFAVPGFCTSRLCGPELEIMRKLLPQYQGRAEFIHVEFYKNPGAPPASQPAPGRTGCPYPFEPVEAVREWNLCSEPWFFVIDGRGIITAKFEGATTLQELDQALKAVTGN